MVPSSRPAGRRAPVCLSRRDARSGLHPPGCAQAEISLCLCKLSAACTSCTWHPGLMLNQWPNGFLSFLPWWRGLGVADFVFNCISPTPHEMLQLRVTRKGQGRNPLESPAQDAVSALPPPLIPGCGFAVDSHRRLLREEPRCHRGSATCRTPRHQACEKNSAAQPPLQAQPRTPCPPLPREVQPAEHTCRCLRIPRESQPHAQSEESSNGRCQLPAGSGLSAREGPRVALKGLH